MQGKVDVEVSRYSSSRSRVAAPLDAGV